MEQMTRYQLYKACPIPGTQAFLAYYNEGDVDKATIEATVANALVGKEFDCYASASQAGRVIVDLLTHSKKWGHLADGYALTYSRETPTLCNVYWNKHWLGSVTVHKKKGPYRSRRYSFLTYDWAIASVEVDGFDDIGAKVEQIKAAMAKAKDAEAQKLKEACDIYRAIKEMFPEASQWQIETKVDYLKKNLWKVEKEVG